MTDYEVYITSFFKEIEKMAIKDQDDEVAYYTSILLLVMKERRRTGQRSNFPKVIIEVPRARMKTAA